MNTLCMIPVWGRHDVLKITFKGLENFAGPLWWVDESFYVLLIVSNREDFTFCSNWAKTSHKHNLKVFIHQAPNQPLGKKLNSGLREAIRIMKSYDIDYLMTSGSDNLISRKVWDYYIHAENDEHPFFGFTNVAIYHKATGEAVEVNYPCASGVGRMHNIWMLKDACDCHVAIAKLSLAGRFGSHGKGERVYIPKNHQPDPDNYEIIGEDWHLWPDDTYNSTDIDSENWLMMSGYACKYIRTPEPLILDIKTDDNISNWEDFKNNKQNRRLTDLGAWAEINQ